MAKRRLQTAQEEVSTQLQTQGSSAPTDEQNVPGDDRIERLVFLLNEEREAKCLASEKQLARRTKLSKKFGSNYEYAVVASDNYSKRKAKGVTCKLPLFKIPLEVRKVVENKLVPEVIRKGLTKENYASYFSTLLIMEELCLENATSCHNAENVTLRRKKADLFVLSVPGLTERRPSLVHGDLISAVLASESANDTRHSHQQPDNQPTDDWSLIDHKPASSTFLDRATVDEYVYDDVSMEHEIQDKRKQMRVLEQRLVENGEASIANASLVEMQQIKSARNRILQEQLQEKCGEIQELQEKIVVLQQRLDSSGNNRTSTSEHGTSDAFVEELQKKIQF